MERALSNKTPKLPGNMNIDAWVVGTSNQLFVRDFYTEKRFCKNEVVTGKTPLFVVCQFCTPRSICLNIGFWQGSCVSECCVFNLSVFN